MSGEIENNLMRDYLLGGLPETEASRLEQDIFADDETFERVWEVENTLVDNYVRGRLSSEDRERFERHYLASTVHRRRVKAAEHLIRRADGLMAETGGLVPKASWPSELFGRYGVPRSLRQFAVAAAVILLVMGTLWLLLERRRLHLELTRLAAEGETQQSQERQLADQLAAAQSQSERLAADLERLRAQQRALSQRSAERPPAPSSPPRVFSFLLSPILPRSGSDPKLLNIPVGTEVVHLRMSVDLNGVRHFQAQLRTVESPRVVWKQQPIRPEIDDSSKATVTARIPARELTRGDYILTLSAVDPAGQPGVVNHYFFRVARQP